MSGNPIYNYISSAAVSLTMAGNTGISPFLTLLLIGLVEMAKPELLNMGETMELLLSSWGSVAILGLLAIGEMVGKCIPAVDEIIDSAQVFVVPVISILATLATMGLLPGLEGTQSDAGQGEDIDVVGRFYDTDDESNNHIGGFYGGGGNRNLQGSFDQDFGEGFMTFTKICLVTIGIGLSLAIHFFKMLVRTSSLICSGGCCQPCITLVEYILVIVGVVSAILAPTFAIIACVVLLIAAGYIIYVMCRKKKEKNSNTNTQNEEKQEGSDDIEDVENRSSHWATTESVDKNVIPEAEIWRIDDEEDAENKNLKWATTESVDQKVIPCPRAGTWRNDDKEDVENRKSQGATTEAVNQKAIPQAEAVVVVDLGDIPMQSKLDRIAAKVY